MKRADSKRGKVSGSKKPKTGRKPKLDLDALLTKIVHIFVRHHPSDLSFSRISQLTGVPRPTLYYYFGNSLEKLLEEATQFGMKAIILLNQFDSHLRESDWNAFQKHRLKTVLEICQRYPWAPTLYFRFRNDPGFMGKSVRDLEEKYCQQMAKAWAHYHKAPPDPRAVRLSSYLKLGILFGFSIEPELWRDERALAKLVEKMSGVVTEVMGEKF